MVGGTDKLLGMFSCLAVQPEAELGSSAVFKEHPSQESDVSTQRCAWLTSAGRPTPSVACIVQPGSNGGFQKVFFGDEEIAIPVYGR